MELLVELLTGTDKKIWTNRAEAISTSMIKAPYDAQENLLQKSLSEDLHSALFKKETQYYAGTYNDSDVSIISIADFENLKKNIFNNNIFIIHIKDKITRVDFPSWAGILRMYNLMQFSEFSLFTTQKGIDKALYDVIDFNTKAKDTSSDDWSIVYEEVLDEAKTLVKQLSKVPGIPVPDVGEEIVDSSNTVLGEAELVWETLKIAVTIEDDFLSEEWILFKINDAEQIIETIQKRINS
jgi:hypothetical protein